KAGSGATDAKEATPSGALPGRPRLVFSADGQAQANTPEARGEERAYFLTHAVTVLGRGNDCDLQLTDPGVSRRHAELRVENDAVMLVALGSTNGIRVNDVAVGRRQLSPADRIQLGSTTLIFQRDES
ncbi:MAG: FHA domain-containing protein, partial [Frankiales bacterium]|nr:FHA domain-containing protein [Frankiales bacterium]